jgi:Fe-S-cluster containining protein
MSKDDQYFFYSPSKKISLQGAKREVDLYIKEHGTSSNWSGCLKKNYCCKLFFYDPKNKEAQDLYDAVFEDKSKLKRGSHCLKCKQLKGDGDKGIKSCSIYKDRPRICRDFLCQPAIIRGKIYKQKQQNSN